MDVANNNCPICDKPLIIEWYSFDVTEVWKECPFCGYKSMPETIDGRSDREKG